MAVEFENPLIAFNAYVSSLSVSLGWGGQGGSMQLKLVEDPDNGYVIDLPSVGTAVYFKYNGFYFGGILQRWTYNESISGRTYDVIIESPAKLMDGVQLIIENFNGATDRWVYTANCPNLDESSGEFTTNVETSTLEYGQITNVYNIFGYYENPLNGLNGPYNNFGASNFNSAGLQVSKILDGITALSQRDSENVFSGPIKFGTGKEGTGDGGTGGDNPGDGPGLPPPPDDSGGTASTGAFSEYILDISEINGIAASDSFGEYRLKGPVKSVNTVLSEMADLFQFDYYYSIQSEVGIPAENGGGSIDLPVIKVKFLDRSEPPQPGKVAEFIGEKRKSGTLISSQLGQEFGDTVTQKIVWGGNRSRYLKLRNTGGGSPHYAILGRQNTITANGTKAYNIPGTITKIYDDDPVNTVFDIYIEGLEDGGSGDFALYRTTAFELRMALGGQQVWEIYKTFETLAGVELNGYNDILDCPWTGAFDNTNDVLALVANTNLANAYDLTLSNVEAASKGNDKTKNLVLNRLFAGVNNIARTSYGQEFLIVLPNENPSPSYNYYLPADEFTYLKTWDVADSAYDSAPITNDISNWTANGRITSMVGWPFIAQNYWSQQTTTPLGGATFAYPDFSPLGSDYAYGNTTGSGACDFSSFMLSKKGGPEQETYWFPAFGSWAVIFRTGAQIRLYDSITTPDFGLSVLAKIFFDLDIPPEKYLTIGKNALQFAIPPDVAVPRFFGIPQESGRFRWGPWVTDPTSLGYSDRGKAQVEEKESLRPETFGSLQTLREVGQLEASVGNSDMQAVESGYVEVAGAPEYNLGERFANTGPYVSNMDISVDVSGGVTTNYKLTTWTPEFGTMNKYNINRIADIKKRSFEYAKKQRDLIEKRPFPAIKFEQNNFDDILSRRQQVDDNAILKLFGQSGADNSGKCPEELCGQDAGSGGPGI